LDGEAEINIYSTSACDYGRPSINQAIREKHTSLNSKCSQAASLHVLKRILIGQKQI